MKKFKLINCFILVAVLVASHAWSATHSLTQWEEGKFDLVVSLGWSPTEDHKTKLKTVFELFAQDVWTMTEGNHSIRRLYVYTPDPLTNKARDWNKADIRFLNTADAANATIAGFKKKGRIFVDDDLSDLAEVGHAMAHELGHYAYAVYDEYKDDQGPADGFPHQDDTPKDSIMNKHWQWQHFSVPDDYSDKTKLKTAHYRMYGESIWETLISDSSLDSLWGDLGYIGYKNDRFEFTDLQALTSVPDPLAKPTDNPTLEIIYMEGSEACIIIDDSGSMGSDGKMAAAISGAKSYLDKLAEDKDYAAVVAFNSSASTIGALGLLDTATKTTFKSSIDGLSAGGGTSFYSALSQGYNILNGSSRKGTFKYIVLLSDGEASVPGTVLTQLNSANIPVYAIGLGSGADMTALGEIASGTNGKSYYAATSATLNAIYSDISSLSNDDKLTTRVKENLGVSKNTASASMVVDASCDSAVFTSSFSSSDTMAMSLVMPDSTTVDASNVDTFDDITLISESGYIIYNVKSPADGTWTVTITASGLTGDSEVIIEGKTDSVYAMNTQTIGGTYPKPVILATTVSKNYPITGLSVSATITAPDNATTTVLLLDDGVAPDVTAGDGEYAGALSSYTDGTYHFEITADNSLGTGAETSRGVTLKKGTPSVNNPITDAFTLMETVSFKTSGVDSYVANTSTIDATGLTVNGDSVSGTISQDGQVVYYYFNAVAGQSYTIYTTGLFPYDMSTLVKLYDADDMDTPLDQDVDSMNNTSAKLLYTPDADELLYITVEHGSSGTGTFDIAVRETQGTDALEKPSDSSDDSSDSGSSGCFIHVLK